ncbi:hypothetical protein C1H46_045589 [Malus baccata]|uniref:Uncharacterized protein n=1 Tax=Malus baccata TaxID=106549 RepID=A0A540K3T0_MALBA|nr:hypothetical protein C1H46_045589 [Malus baccata]
MNYVCFMACCYGGLKIRATRDHHTTPMCFSISLERVVTQMFEFWLPLVGT